MWKSVLKKKFLTFEEWKVDFEIFKSHICRFSLQIFSDTEAAVNLDANLTLRLDFNKNYQCKNLISVWLSMLMLYINMMLCPGHTHTIKRHDDTYIIVIYFYWSVCHTQILYEREWSLLSELHNSKKWPIMLKFTLEI